MGCRPIGRLVVGVRRGRWAISARQPGVTEDTLTPTPGRRPGTGPVPRLVGQAPAHAAVGPHGVAARTRHPPAGRARGAP